MLTLHGRLMQMYRNAADKDGVEEPAMAHPAGFHLVFWENGRDPIYVSVVTGLQFFCVLS